MEISRRWMMTCAAMVLALGCEATTPAEPVDKDGPDPEVAVMESEAVMELAAMRTRLEGLISEREEAVVVRDVADAAYMEAWVRMQERFKRMFPDGGIPATGPYEESLVYGEAVWAVQDLDRDIHLLRKQIAEADHALRVRASEQQGG